MQDNDFEKQVHKMMGEMKILPSETVWGKVEMRLHHKEKRRRWFIWLPLLMAGLLLGGYLTWNTLQSSHENHLPSFTTTQQSKQINKTINPALKKNKETTKPDTTLAMGVDKVLPGKLRIPGNHNNTTINTTKSHRIKQDAGKPVSTKNSGTNALENFRQDTADLLSENIRLENSQATTEPALQEETSKELNPVAIKGYQLVSTGINTSRLLVRSDLNTNVVTSLQHTNKSWEWGLSFQAGKSSLHNGTVNKSSRTQLNYQSSPSNAVGPVPNAIYKEPYPLKNAAGFSAGMFVKKQLSPRVALSIGVNYTLYTTTNWVGRKIDSNMAQQYALASNRLDLNRFYRTGNTDKHTNNFHFIEVPISLQTRLVRSRKMPLYWDLGFSVSRLISSNTLHFDRVSGIYYQDIDQLNKTQVNVSTGLPVRLFSGKQYALQAGPTFQYGLSQVFKPETNPGKHFFFMGLKANLVIGKK